MGRVQGVQDQRRNTALATWQSGWEEMCMQAHTGLARSQSTETIGGAQLIIIRDGSTREGEYPLPSILPHAMLTMGVYNVK